MNLGQYLADILLEAEDQPTIALFPGAFKPPHKGHVDVVNKLLKAADQVVVLVSPKTREGVTSDESIAVWNLYKDKGLFNGSVEIKVSADPSPVKELYGVIENNPDTEFLAAFGKGDIDRYKSIEKYPNVKVFDAGAVEGVNATNLRMALAQTNEEDIAKYLPTGVSVDEFLQALNTKPEEKPEETPAEQPPAETPPAEPAPEQPLKESPPINFEDESPYENYVTLNRPKIEKAAAVFNTPIPDVEYAFNSGDEVVLNDDIWSKLENSKSYKMKTLDDAIQHSLKLGINPKPYIDQIKAGKEMPLPLVLCYGQDKYYLVGGEVVLSLYRALGSIPTVLQGTLNLQTKTLPEPLHEGVDNKTIKKFIGFAINELGIQKPPTGLTLSRDNNAAKSMHTFGVFNPNNDKIWLYVKNRNMADILRTLAHELVHRKQAEDGRIDMNSGETGSEIENEANAMAGVLLRNFGKQNENIYEGLEKFDTPITLCSRLSSQLYELKVNEITLNPENAVEIDGDLFSGEFKVGDIEYIYSIKSIPNPYQDNELFYSIQFDEKFNDASLNEPTKKAKENYIKILSTIFKIILNFAKKEKPKYIGISSLNKSGYGNIYNNLSKTNKIPGYTRKNAGLDFTTKSGETGQFIVLKKTEDKQLKEGVYGDYLFGDENSGVLIGWYKDEMEEDTPAERILFTKLKNYADSESDVYTTISLDDLIPIFKKIKKQYPEIGEPNISGYIYRGTAIPEEKLRELESKAKTQPYSQGIILLDQTYSSRRQVQSWSTSYYPAAGFAVTTAKRNGGKPVIMRAKAEDADLFLNPKFMEKLSTQLEDETFNITRPIPVDIMVIEDYEDEFEDIEAGYLHTKQK